MRKIVCDTLPHFGENHHYFLKPEPRFELRNLGSRIWKGRWISDFQWPRKTVIQCFCFGCCTTWQGSLDWFDADLSARPALLCVFPNFIIVLSLPTIFFFGFKNTNTTNIRDRSLLSLWTDGEVEYPRGGDGHWKAKKERKNIIELHAKSIKTSRVDFAVIRVGVQLCSTITEILVQKHFLI